METPNGLIRNLCGLVEGKRHDSGMLPQPSLLPQLQQFAPTPCVWEPVCIQPTHFEFTYKKQEAIRSNSQQKAFNTAIINVRVAVEWLFKEITTYFVFLDFKKDLKIGLSPVRKMYIVCALMLELAYTNLRHLIILA